MKLNLGCSDSLLPGFVNVDIVAPADVIADLSLFPWPWETDSVSHIRCHDLLEHLPDKILTMNEIWRVLKPSGTIEIKVPTTDGPGAWCDPQHVSYWNRLSFEYYTRGNPARERFCVGNGVHASFDVVSERKHTWPNGVVDLNITLRAVK
jgi:SAM-dependent methyltransferase